ncbi:tripartite tricarboxylate transporter substrate binding protein [Nocardioidaceae bacterium]|nr:tripartite tricarboxylate transporter substrate binding protein [Nocardioidaceae bacterium]
MTDPTSERATGTRSGRVRLARATGAVVAAGVVAAAVATSAQSAGVSTGLRTKATLIAPASAGGGWDTFMRESQNAMRENGIGTNVQVLNVPGAAGTIGLTNLARRSGEAGTVMVGGTGLVAGVEQLDTGVTMDDVTPVVRVVEEYDVVVVPADSSLRTLEDLIEAWTAEPGAVPFTGGGSFDQLVMAELAISAGLDPTEVNYIPASGGGEVAQSLVTGTAAAATSGFPDVDDQIASGRLRALGLVAEDRLDGVDIPTLREQGHDVTLSNWRAVYAPPGVTDAQVREIRAVYADIVETPEWKDAVRRNQWSTVWLEGAELRRFARDEQQRVADLYEELGL